VAGVRSRPRASRTPLCGQHAHGLDASGYTFAYVAGWAGGDLTHVRQAAETVTKAARTILGHCSTNAATGSDDLADTA